MTIFIHSIKMRFFKPRFDWRFIEIERMRERDDDERL